MERCQQAEVRCTAMQQTYVLVQSGNFVCKCFMSVQLPLFVMANLMTLITFRQGWRQTLVTASG